MTTPSAGNEVAVDVSWLDRLPQFCSAKTVAEVFDISARQAGRWMGDETSALPRAKRPDNRWVTSRAHVIALANRMYGEMGASTTSDPAICGLASERDGDHQ